VLSFLLLTLSAVVLNVLVPHLAYHNKLVRLLTLD
jgi:hypothetical protein